MRRIRWIGVVLGTVTALLAGRLLSLAAEGFYRIIAFDGGERGTFVLSSDSQPLALAVEVLGVAVAWALPLFLGGIVAGRLVCSYAGLNCALTAALGALVGAVTFLWGVLPLVPDVSISLPSVPRSGQKTWA